MKKHERILKAYKRNHQGESIDETERGKISKEKNHVKKLTNKANAFFNKALTASSVVFASQKPASPPDFFPVPDDSSLDKAEDILYQSKKVSGNVKAHRTRLRELQKNDDFV